MGFWCQLLRRHYSGTSLKSLATHLRDNSKRVMVMAGAGLSTPSGIPDFRQVICTEYFFFTESQCRESFMNGQKMGLVFQG